MANFEAAALAAIALRAEAMWTGAQALNNPVNAEAARAVLVNQTAQFREFDDYTTKNKKVNVTWLDTCDLVDEECEPNCEITGPEIDAQVEEYEPTICRKIDFSVDETAGRDDIYTVQEKSAAALSRAIGKLDEFWARQVMSSLDLYAGVNAFPAPWTYDAANRTTNIPAAQYNLSMYANLILQAQRNNLGNAYFIENGDLMAELLNAQLDGGNWDGKGDLARSQALRMYHDLFNFGKAGVTDSLFAINPNAVAMKTVNYNADSPKTLGGTVQQVVYTVPSRVLPGVKYDVYYSFTCTTPAGAARAHYVHAWRIETNGFVALNPTDCPITVGGTEVNPTGVLGYTKVTE